MPMKTQTLILIAATAVFLAVVRFGGMPVFKEPSAEKPGRVRVSGEFPEMGEASSSSESADARGGAPASVSAGAAGSDANPSSGGKARLRAQKAAVEAAGKGRATPEQALQVEAAFRFLEQQAAQPVVVRLLSGPGITHYTVSRRDDGSEWVLLESISGAQNRGGLNLRWDAAKGEIVSMWAWGPIAAE